MSRKVKTGSEIIQEALEVKYQEEPKTFIDKLFYREPSESKLKSSAIMHLTDKFITERHRADQSEQKMYEGIRESLRFIEQRDPEEARRLYQKYLTPQND
jgi:hypothetical protein